MESTSLACPLRFRILDQGRLSVSHLRRLSAILAVTAVFLGCFVSGSFGVAPGSPSETLSSSSGGLESVSTGVVAVPPQEKPGLAAAVGYDSLKARAEELARRVSVDSTSYDLNFELANIYYDMGSLLMAAKHFRKASELNPTSAKAFVNLGVVLNEMGQSEDAVVAFDKALAIDPKDIKALCNKGLAFYGLQKYSEAIAQYRKALELDEKSVEAHYNMGVAFADAQIFREAVVEWQIVVKLAPESDAAKAAKANIEVVQQYFRLD